MLLSSSTNEYSQNVLGKHGVCIQSTFYTIMVGIKQRNKTKHAPI